MSKSKPKPFLFFLVSNLGYKALALIITLFLWTFVMGRNDAVESREFDILVQLPDSHILERLEPRRVQVKIQGAPKLLRRYFQNKRALVFEIYNTGESLLRLEIREEKLELPFGLRLVSLQPRYFDVRMQEKVITENRIKDLSIEPNEKKD